MNSLSYLYPNYRIVQFAKAPEAGKVKTRLQSVLGESGCLKLHTRLVEQCFGTLRGVSAAPVEIVVAGSSSEYFEQLTKGLSVPIAQQQGGDLGERMMNAATERLNCASAVIIVGSDCPFFDDNYLHAACQALAQGADCVIGPALDGGYVLIGLRRADATLFSDVPWGTDQVLGITRERLSNLGWQWSELEPKADIDLPQDLPLLQQVWSDAGDWLESISGI